MLGAQPLQQRPVVGQMLYVQRDGGGYMPFKLCLALRDPARDTKYSQPGSAAPAPAPSRRACPTSPAFHRDPRIAARLARAWPVREQNLPRSPPHPSPEGLQIVRRCPKSWSETLKVRSSSLYRQYHGEGAASSLGTPAFGARHGPPVKVHRRLTKFGSNSFAGVLRSSCLPLPATMLLAPCPV